MRIQKLNAKKTKIKILIFVVLFVIIRYLNFREGQRFDKGFFDINKIGKTELNLKTGKYYLYSKIKERQFGADINMIIKDSLSNELLIKLTNSKLSNLISGEGFIINIFKSPNNYALNGKINIKKNTLVIFDSNIQGPKIFKILLKKGGLDNEKLEFIRMILFYSQYLIVFTLIVLFLILFFK